MAYIDIAISFPLLAALDLATDLAPMFIVLTFTSFFCSGS